MCWVSEDPRQAAKDPISAVYRLHQRQCGRDFLARCLDSAFKGRSGIQRLGFAQAEIGLADQPGFVARTLENSVTVLDAVFTIALAQIVGSM
jgi:hypothetical protein